MWETQTSPDGTSLATKYSNRTTYIYRNINPCNSILMVNVSSGIDRGRVRAPNDRMTTSRNMAAMIIEPNITYTIELWMYGEAAKHKRSVRVA